LQDVASALGPDEQLGFFVVMGDVLVDGREREFWMADARPCTGRTLRGAVLAPLRTALAGYAEIAQPRWVAWLRKQRLDNTIPTQFSKVLQSVVSFADWMIESDEAPSTWDPAEGKWIGVRG
jgi:hypothetical protein